MAPLVPASLRRCPADVEQVRQRAAGAGLHRLRRHQPGARCVAQEGCQWFCVSDAHTASGAMLMLMRGRVLYRCTSYPGLCLWASTIGLMHTPAGTARGLQQCAQPHARSPACLDHTLAPLPALTTRSLHCLLLLLPFTHRATTASRSCTTCRPTLRWWTRWQRWTSRRGRCTTCRYGTPTLGLIQSCLTQPFPPPPARHSTCCWGGTEGECTVTCKQSCTLFVGANVSRQAAALPRQRSEPPHINRQHAHLASQSDRPFFVLT